jgi:flagellar biosynthesis activator protein FlaF
MQEKQIEAYKTAQKAIMSGREIEAAALNQAAMMLKECQKNWDAPGRAAVLHEVLKFNQVLWSIFQAELTQEGNPLPRELRENILSLSAFVDKRIFDIMAVPSPEKLNAVIDINMNLAAGLRGEL